jgi:methylated-DNA-protein-cysteine methyltransferase related protein
LQTQEFDPTRRRAVRHPADMTPRSERDREILERVRATPEGFVRSYGDVSPGAPRRAGAVLFACDDPSVPWHRIVRADGSLAKGERQRELLLAEGVPFRGERVDMRRVRMAPEFRSLASGPDEAAGNGTSQ